MPAPTSADSPSTRHLGALLLCGLVLATGCVAGPTGGSPERTPPAATATPDAAPVAEYEGHVFDHWETGSPAIEGGIAYAPGREYTERYYVTTVATAAEADRFNSSVLRPAANAFVRNTTFRNATLVVIQAFPASSHPDYRVESVRRRDGTLEVAINDSSRGGTADITVETVLLRVPDPVDRVAVTTEDGVTFDSTAGVVTPKSTPEPTPDDPLGVVPDERRLADGGDLRIVNRRAGTVGYNLTLTYYYEPRCRDETPACGAPARRITVDRAIAKLPPGGNETLTDVATHRGTYTVHVTADLPTGNGSRRSVTESFAWRVDGPGVEGVVAITGDGVSFSTGE